MKKILLIEDNEHVRQNTAEILELANYEVHVAENGKQGLEKAMEILPDLIICDIMMPVLDGYGVLYLLQKKNQLKHTPFIFLTALGEKTEMRKGMEMGADDYITKPFEGTELLRAVDSRLKKMELLQSILPSGPEGMNELKQLSSNIESLGGLAEGRNTYHYQKKQVVYHEGHRPTKLYYIEKGKVKTFKSNEDGKELVTGIYQEGDFFGYVAMLEGTQYKETAEAIEEGEIALIPREDFEELMNGHSAVARKFVAMLAKNVREREEQLLAMAYCSLRKKIANTLMMLHRKYKSSINISRENLAAIAGTATESLIRTLGDFKAEQLIDIRKGEIFILNEKKLENMVN